MSKIFDRLEHSRKFVSNPGSRFKEEFHGVLGDDGYITLVSDGFTDLQEYIEAEAVGSDIKSLINRALGGDLSVFREDGFYADVTGIPKTYADILNLVNDAKRKFEGLPVELREKFNGDFEMFFATMGSEDWYNRLGLNKAEEKTNESEVKAEE